MAADASYLEALVQDLRHRDGVKRSEARSRLIDLGPVSVPLILPLLGDGDKRTRWEAAKVLSEMPGLDAAPAAPGDIAAQALPLLEDKDSGVRWLAAELLINLGADAIAPLLRRLIDAPGSQYLQQGAHHVFRGLAAAFESVGDILSPLNEALAGLDAADLSPQRAQTALRAIETQGPFPRRPDAATQAPAPDQYLFDSRGDWIAFRRGNMLFDVDGDVIGWLPWDDGEAVNPRGHYLGTIVPDDRLLFAEPMHATAPPFPEYPVSPELPPIPKPRGYSPLYEATRDVQLRKL